MPRRTKWTKINRVSANIKRRATVKLQCKRTSSQYQCDDTVLSIVMIVWTHQLYHTAIVTGLEVAELYSNTNSSVFAVRLQSTACNATHGIARPVCPSVCHVYCDKTRETSAHIDLYHMKDHSSFSDKKNGGGVDPFYLEFWDKLALFGRKRRFSIDIRSYRVSRNTKKCN